MNCALRLDLSSYTEDWFHVMVEKVDVAGAFQMLENLATAEQRATVTHTNSIARELRVTTARVESIAQEGNDMARILYSELMICIVRPKVQEVHDSTSKRGILFSLALRLTS